VTAREPTATEAPQCRGGLAAANTAGTRSRQRSGAEGVETSPAAGVRPIAAAEAEVAAVLLARAFDADPMFRFLLPDGRNRAVWLRVLMGLSVAQALARGGAWTTADHGGAILTADPGGYPFAWHHGAGVLLRWWRWPGLPVPTLRLVRDGLAVDRAMARLHLRQPHVYVHVLGVDPARQGTGAGGRLMRHAVARAEAIGVPLYLETTNPRNLSFYRHCGLDVCDEVTCAPGAPPLWTMIHHSFKST